MNSAHTAKIERAQSRDAQAISELLAVQLREHGIEVEPQRLLDSTEQLCANEQAGFILTGKVGEEIVGLACVALILTLEHGGQSMKRIGHERMLLARKFPLHCQLFAPHGFGLGQLASLLEHPSQ